MGACDVTYEPPEDAGGGNNLLRQQRAHEIVDVYACRYPRRMPEQKMDEVQERKDNYAASTRANVIPVMIVRTTHTTVIKLSRVPCVDEFIHIGPSDTHPSALTHWRVVSVVHMPPVEGNQWSEAVAEIHVLKVEDDDYDPWAGKHPSQRK